MYSTEKKVSKLVNQQILGPVLAVFGIIQVAIRLSGSGFSFGALGDGIHGLIMMGIGIAITISSSKRINAIKGRKFDITPRGIDVYDFDESRLIPVSSIGSIDKGVKELRVTIQESEEDILFSLDDYSLSFKQSKELQEKINELKKASNNL